MVGYLGFKVDPKIHCVFGCRVSAHGLSVGTGDRAADSRGFRQNPKPSTDMSNPAI